MTYPAALPDPMRDAQFYEGVSGRRLIAWLIDLALITAINVAIHMLALGTFLLLGIGLWMITEFAYRTLTISGRSATLGMRIMGIELRDSLGQRLGFGAAAIHTGLYMISVAAGAILQFISLVMMVGSARGQGLHDMLLGTVMINRPAE